MIINDIYNKWKDLVSKYSKGLVISAFYISKHCQSKLFLGYDGEKKYVYLEFDSSSIKTFKCPKAKGLDIEIVDEPSIDIDYKYVRITNIENKEEVFLAFCGTLYDGLRECQSYYDVAETLVATIKYYKTYFSNPNKPLSEYEEQGLFCELVFLERMVGKYGEISILNWQGPNKNKRDFVFNDRSIEIKSTAGQINPSIRISNELQLDNSYPENINLFLKVFVVEKLESGECLTSVAKRILDNILDINLKKEFIQKLIMSRVDLSLYEDINHYSIQEEHLYYVKDDFPAIKKSNIDKDIFKVEYYLLINNLKRFEVDD